MSGLQELLEWRARDIEPGAEALHSILRSVGRRRWGRRLVAAAAAGAVVAAGIVSVPGPSSIGVLPEPPQQISDAKALAVRAGLGIEGPTKGAPSAVVVRNRAPGGKVELSLVRLQTGQATPLPGNVTDATVSPDGGTVAAVRDDHVVVAPTQSAGATRVVPRTSGAEGTLSWDPNGGALLTMVRGRWVSVTNPTPYSEVDPRHAPSVRPLDVPKIPGGPIVLSVSPAGTLALLFGVTYSRDAAPRPHLFLGAFDGTSVTDLQRIPIPEGAVDGPMGWVGENAFLLAPADGEALIVRTDGTRVLVRADPMVDPCSFVAPLAGCAPSGPRLLGTDTQGSLLFWRLAARLAGDANPGDATGGPAPIVLYYKTWLDGTHPVRLIGPAGAYGPPLAAR